MERHQARRGVQVRVGEGYRKAELRGALGTVQQIWGNPNYHTALLVRLEDERYEVFWDHDLQMAVEDSIGDEEQDPDGHNPEFERSENAIESLLRASKEIVDMSRAERARHKWERDRQKEWRAG